MNVPGSWTVGLDEGKAPSVNFLNSSQQTIREDLPYSREDYLAVEEWVKR